MILNLLSSMHCKVHTESFVRLAGPGSCLANSFSESTPGKALAVPLFLSAGPRALCVRACSMLASGCSEKTEDTSWIKYCCFQNYRKKPNQEKKNIKMHGSALQGVLHLQVSEIFYAVTN